MRRATCPPRSPGLELACQWPNTTQTTAVASRPETTPYVASGRRGWPTILGTISRLMLDSQLVVYQPGQARDMAIAVVVLRE
jgi:hypothetical protein